MTPAGRALGRRTSTRVSHLPLRGATDRRDSGSRRSRSQSASLDCDVEPPRPGLKTDSGPFAFFGACCSAAARTQCELVVLRLLAGRLDPELGTCARLGLVGRLVGVVRVPPLARESTVFDCHTEPPYPGLSTRAGSFTFDAPDGHPHGERPAFCSANEAASEPWPFQEDCPTTWIPIAGVAAALAAAAALGLGCVLIDLVAVRCRCVAVDAVRLAHGRRCRGSEPGAACSRSTPRPATPPRARPRPGGSSLPGRRPGSRAPGSTDLPADCVWVASWSTWFRLEALASLSTLLVCQTSPSLPQLLTLIGSFLFDASFWIAADRPSAICSFFED